MNVLKKLQKGVLRVSSALTLMIALMQSAYAEAASVPSNIDTTAYDTLVSIVFWVVRIAVLAISVVPSIIKIAQGQANEDVRERNGGIALFVIGGALFGITFAIEALF